jgi:hypothetical protein
MIIMLFGVANMFSQTPQAFNWQFVLRDDAGGLSSDKNVSVRLSIHEVTQTGTVVYSEEFAVMSEKTGLVNLQAGRGTVLSGDFSTISWGANAHFVQIEVDFLGGTTYEDLGTSQLVSIPYALNAASVDCATISLGTYGGIALPQDIPVCDAQSEGTLMYNSATQKVQFCDGTSWQNVDGTQ